VRRGSLKLRSLGKKKAYGRAKAEPNQLERHTGRWTTASEPVTSASPRPYPKNPRGQSAPKATAARHVKLAVNSMSLDGDSRAATFYCPVRYDAAPRLLQPLARNIARSPGRTEGKKGPRSRRLRRGDCDDGGRGRVGGGTTSGVRAAARGLLPTIAGIRRRTREDADAFCGRPARGRGRPSSANVTIGEQCLREKLVRLEC
jgi:hypothetical protein